MLKFSKNLHINFERYFHSASFFRKKVKKIKYQMIISKLVVLFFQTQACRRATKQREGTSDVAL